MELIARLLPEPKEIDHKTYFVRHKKSDWAVTFNPYTGIGFYETREEAESQAKIRSSYDKRDRVIVFDKHYDSFLIGSKL